MTLVDDRGRIGGRVNLVDAIVAVVILGLIPVAYGAYLLFRMPPATLSSIEKTQLYQGKNLRIVVNGKNLRPFMRVSFNGLQGRTFLLGSTKYAEIDLPDLDPGVYDVVLERKLLTRERLELEALQVAVRRIREPDRAVARDGDVVRRVEREPAPAGDHGVGAGRVP